MKKYFFALFLLIAISIIIFVIRLLIELILENSYSFLHLMDFSVGMSLNFFALALGRQPNNLEQKDILKILAFLSTVTIAAIIIINIICNEIRLSIIILRCIALPLLSFVAYFISKHFLREKKKIKSE
ncbi:MAG: hypothetical protein LBT56_03105 [Prevotellaceae bacterium]|jgi:hypothetical protein|nr:hypothetical protein [Prevotellaceae bacterium]